MFATEIVERLKNVPTDERPFRPKLSLLADVPKFVTDCITDCWNEEQNQRPEFKVIRRLLKPMQVGMYVTSASLLSAIFDCEQTHSAYESCKKLSLGEFSSLALLFKT